MTRLTLPLALLAATLAFAIVYALCVAAAPEQALRFTRVSLSCRPVPLLAGNYSGWENRT